ncbi:MAG TPA: hypothetical protein VFL61_01580 [Gaiellaceae bacterium]|nr:hypothetical protein [Gaiellaceae bacterium]
MHNFLVFGFPGETDADAQITIDFIVEHADIVSSYGAGTFSLEHNSPIFHHYLDYGVRLKPNRSRDLDVYYEYEVDEGVTPERALFWRDATEGIPHYRATNWVPRESLLCLLSVMTADDMFRIGPAVRDHAGLPGGATLEQFVTYVEPDSPTAPAVMINRVNGRVLHLGPSAARLASACLRAALDVQTIEHLAPELFERLAYFQSDRDGVAPRAG